VIVDSGLNWDGMVSFVATDNRKGARSPPTASASVCRARAGAGDAVPGGVGSTMEREAGFLDEIKAKYRRSSWSRRPARGATIDSAQKTGGEPALK